MIGDRKEKKEKNVEIFKGESNNLQTKSERQKRKEDMRIKYKKDKLKPKKIEKRRN